MKQLIFTLLALPMLFVACNNEEPEGPKPGAAKLTLTSDSVVEFSADGGVGTITYNYDTSDIVGDDILSTEIAMLKIACDAAWVEVAEEVAPLGEIVFTVAKNNTAEARETTITATLNTHSFSVVVKQLAGVATPEPTIEGWGIVGTMNDWDVSKTIVMEEVEDYYVAKAVELGVDDKFKFIKDGDNAQNRGGNGRVADPDYIYTAQQWGSDIRVSEAGKFDIYLNTKADKYYIMTEGKSPAEALEPLAPGETLIEAYGNFANGESVRFTAEGKYMVAKGVAFSTTTAEFTIHVNGDEVIYGAKQSDIYAVEEEIDIVNGDTKVVVSVESGVKYDIFYREDRLSVWLMPAGQIPVIWKEVTGVAFSSTNYGVFLIAEGMDLIFDFYCEESTNSIIPEGRYYVSKEDGTSDFNYDVEYIVRINGVKSFPKDGYMDIKHIPGGYDIVVDMTSIHNHIIKAHYAGPIGDVPIMGRPITNPE